MTPTPEERLRQAMTESHRRQASTADCPQPEELWAASRGELPAGEARQIVDHSLDCAACAESLQLARAVDRGVETLGRKDHEGRRWTRQGAGQRWLAAAAAAAALWITVGVGWWQFGPGSPPENEFRQPQGATIESALATGSELPRGDFVLRWSPIDPAALHSVRIATQDLRVLHRAQGIEGGEYVVPAETFEGLPGGTTVLWSVEAVKADSTRVQSETFRVVLK